MARTSGNSFRIIGIDPGSRITGYGIIDVTGSEFQFVCCGVVKSTASHKFPQRLKELFDGIHLVVSEYKPECAAVEDIFFAKNPQSALKLGQARGAVIMALVTNQLLVDEFTAKQVKQAVAGYGQASKAQVQHMVRVLLGLTSSPSEDASDALAVAICMANHLGGILSPDKL
nr:crossover junction endodeoxyribonuclease RuvC [Desulfobulbaceae bacterium]